MEANIYKLPQDGTQTILKTNKHNCIFVCECVLDSMFSNLIINQLLKDQYNFLCELKSKIRLYLTFWLALHQVKTHFCSNQLKEINHAVENILVDLFQQMTLIMTVHHSKHKERSNKCIYTCKGI